MKNSTCKDIHLLLYLTKIYPYSQIWLKCYLCLAFTAHSSPSRNVLVPILPHHPFMQQTYLLVAMALSSTTLQSLEKRDNVLFFFVPIVLGVVPDT